MSNLKKVFALALVFALSLTLFAGAAFTDQADIAEDYIDDVNMLVELGVVGGYPDGSFKPENTITRAEFAKLAYVLKYGVDDSGKLFADQKSIFTDVENDASVAWAKGYINYCASQKIVGGVGNNRFNPRGNITVAEASKMLLVILGADPIKEGFGGSNWISNTVSKAMELGVYKDWTGNPNEPATRQLVAKLIKNTILAPVYLYSSITGLGSQVNIFDPEIKNETLGERTMGLKHVTGIVIANENYAIDIDEEGEALDLNSVPGNQTEGKSLVYYEYISNGDVKHHAIEIDRALDDDLLGNMVDVYFTAHGTEGNYTNVKVLGNVIVNSQTKAYDVASPDVRLMPDGESTSSREVKPYIEFKADGKTLRMESKSDTPKVAQNSVYNGEAFTGRAFISNTTFKQVDEGLLDHPTAGSRFFTQMGEDSIAQYRFVSVDGGKTFSYVFKFHNSANAFLFGNVSAYNEAKSTITLSGVGTESLDNVIIHGNVEKDDDVIIYMANGKINVAKVSVITGLVTAISPEGVATIGGEQYRADKDICVELGADGDLSRYYANNKSSINENTRYWVYNGFILGIEPASASTNIADYAVILSSSYDPGVDSARVKLAFSDNTEGVYEISKFYTVNSANPAAEGNERAHDFANNAKFGFVYKYSISGGRVDLSAQPGFEANSSNGYSVVGGAFKVDNATTGGVQYYYASTNSTLFLLYGNIDNENPQNSIPVKAKAYKLKDITDINSRPINGLSVSNQDYSQTTVGNVVVDDTSTISSLVVGVMTVGQSIPPIVPETDDIAYVVSAKQVYNVVSNKWYLRVKMISEDGLLEVDSVDEPVDSTGTSSALVGNPRPNQEIPGYGRGTIVRFKLNEEGKLTTIDNSMGTAEDMKKPITNNGFYYVNATVVNNGLVGFFPYGEIVELENGRLPAASSAMALDEEYEIITINDGEYVGNYLASAPKGIAIDEDDFNAIIQVRSGKIVKIFSFENF